MKYKTVYTMSLYHYTSYKPSMLSFLVNFKERFISTKNGEGGAYSVGHVVGQLVHGLLLEEEGKQMRCRQDRVVSSLLSATVPCSL